MLFILLIFPLVGCNLNINYTDDPMPTGTPIPGVTGTPTPTPMRIGGGTDGFKIVFNSQRNNSLGGSDIFSMDIDGGNVTQLTTDNNKTMNNNPELSPDGSKVLYLKRKYSPTDGTVASLEVWVMNVDGTGGTPVYTYPHTTEQQWIMYATWTPAGKIIVADKYDFKIIPYIGAAPTVITVPTINGSKPYIWSVPRVSPNGDQIVFDNWIHATQRNEIYVAYFNGSTISNPIKIYDGWFFDSYWSPDGTKIICSGNLTNTYPSNIYMLNKIDALNANGTQLTKDVTYVTPIFSSDGQKIIFTNPSNTYAEIYSIDKPNGQGTLNLGLTSLTNNNFYDGYFERDRFWTAR